MATALAAGLSHEQAGDLEGVSSRTVARRLRDPAFAQRVMELRGARVAQVTGRLGELAGSAVDALGECLDGDDESLKLRATQQVLTLLLRFSHDVDLDARVASIEARLDDPTRTAGTSG